MQSKRGSLRLGLLALIVVIVISALGSLSLARDAFDADYADCSQNTRLSAVQGLAVERTEDEDEIRISWDALNVADLDELGANVLRARITVIVEDGGDEDPRYVPLGEISMVVDDVDFAKDLTVSVAITQDDFVISDIAEAEFTSGIPAPSFMTNILANVADANDVDGDADLTELIPDGVDYGDFYYLGFNDLFDNWYVSDKGDATTLITRPVSPKFRVGLQHGAADIVAGDADFDSYRITIEDGNGDLLGYQATTVPASAAYTGNVITFNTGNNGTTPLDVDDIDGTDNVVVSISNIRLSNQVDDGFKAPYYEEARFTTVPTNSGLSYGNVTAISTTGTLAPAATDLYATPPVEYFDFPNDVFEGDGNYTIKAWAENDEGTRISPQSSVVLSVQEGTSITASDFEGYGATSGVREFDGATTRNIVLAVWGLSIQDN